MPSPKPGQSPDEPLINAQADRLLGRIIVRYGAITLIVLILVTFGFSFINVPQSPLYKDRRFLDTLSVLLILLPFFLGINRLFAARLKIGRELVKQRAWRQAIAALDPFAGPTQRFLDSTGEAHALLVRAYAGAGETAKAEAARAFVLRHRPGPWADAVRQERSQPPAKSARRHSRPASKKPNRRF